jgi:hypothetical protein
MFTAASPGKVLLLSADLIENTVSLTVLRFVYQAVAQQRLDQIRYSIFYYKLNMEKVKT